MNEDIKYTYVIENYYTEQCLFRIWNNDDGDEVYQIWLSESRKWGSPFTTSRKWPGTDKYFVWKPKTTGWWNKKITEEEAFLFLI